MHLPGRGRRAVKGVQVEPMEDGMWDPSLGLSKRRSAARLLRALVVLCVVLGRPTIARASDALMASQLDLEEQPGWSFYDGGDAPEGA